MLFSAGIQRRGRVGACAWGDSTARVGSANSTAKKHRRVGLMVIVVRPEKITGLGE